MSNNLKPCPFCGEKEEYRVNNWEEIYKFIHLLIGEPYEN